MDRIFNILESKTLGTSLKCSWRIYAEFRDFGNWRTIAAEFVINLADKNKKKTINTISSRQNIYNV